MKLKKIDHLTLGFIITTAILISLGGHTTDRIGMAMLVRVICIAFAAILIYWESKTNNRIVSLLREAYPLIFSGYFYQETASYNKLFFKSLDPFFSNLEISIFGCQPSLEFSNIMPMHWFSEIMYLGYFSFYLLIAGFCIALYYEHSTHISKCIFSVTCSFFIFYLIFAIFPTSGPQYYFQDSYTKVPAGYLFSNIVRFIQSSAEQPTGAFPSSHVGISLVIIALSAKYAFNYFKLICPIVFILILSTVYIKAHYLVDVIGAFLIFPLILGTSNLLYRYFPQSKKLN